MKTGFFNLPRYERGRLAIVFAKQNVRLLDRTEGKSKSAVCVRLLSSRLHETTLAAGGWTRLVTGPGTLDDRKLEPLPLPHTTKQIYCLTLSPRTQETHKANRREVSKKVISLHSYYPRDRERGRLKWESGNLPT